jgi:hypothetical protein
MLQELEKFAYATSLDLNMGYYTIKLDYDAQKLWKARGTCKQGFFCSMKPTWNGTNGNTEKMPNTCCGTPSVAQTLSIAHQNKKM